LGIWELVGLPPGLKAIQPVASTWDVPLEKGQLQIYQ